MARHEAPYDAPLRTRLIQATSQLDILTAAYLGGHLGPLLVARDLAALGQEFQGLSAAFLAFAAPLPPEVRYGR